MNFEDFNRIALAQMNVCVGDLTGNTDAIIKRIVRARDELAADTIIFPELALSGYPPEDLLLRPDFHTQTRNALSKIVANSESIRVIIGHTEQIGEKIFNVCSLILDGKIISTYRKRELPNYSVFDEKRYFSSGNEPVVHRFGEHHVALSICEDLWTPEHCQEAAAAGASVLININASPYHLGKAQIREDIIRSRAVDNGLAIIYVNMVGGQDELVFDGDSMLMDEQGEIQFRAPRFSDDMYLLQRQQDEKAFAVSENRVNRPADSEAEIYQALVTGVQDYAGKNGFSGAVIGLSGGIDSALTLAIAVDALGAANTEVLLMPSRYTAVMSITDSIEMADGLGVSHHTLSIEPLFNSFIDLLQPLFAGQPADATEENIQARCRGILLMAMSNKNGKLLLTTGNKSEMAVGYATLYGDMAGGFAPLKDVSKTLVYRLANWCNRQNPVIPRRIIDRPPSAELRPGQKDEDTLPPYEILDPLLERYIEKDQSPAEIVSAGFDSSIVAEVVKLVDRNEYKRRQAAPGTRITARAFGRDRRYPITSRYRETL